MKHNRNCDNCKKAYQLDGRGLANAKYCKPCAKKIKVANAKIGSAKSHLKKQVARGYVVPDEKDLLFYGYKEPLKKVVDGFGYYGVVKYSKDKDKVQCHICGKLFRNVGSHSAFAHDTLARDYKIKYGLALTTALVGEGTRDKMIIAHNEISSFSTHHLTPEERRARMKKMSDMAVNKGRGGWSLERRNQNGNCPDQLIDRIKKLQKKLGYRPSAKDYQKEYGSHSSIITVYGTWNEALRVAGIGTYNDERSVASDPEWLLEQLRVFYKKHGRTARASDSKRGLIPAMQMYWKVFGDINKARQLAKVPCVIQISKYRYEEVII